MASTILSSSPNSPLALPFKIQFFPLHKFPIILPSLSRASKTSLGFRPLFSTPASPSSDLTNFNEKPEISLPETVSEHIIEKSVLLLKQAAETRMVPAVDILSAISAIKKAKVASTLFLESLGGSESPGRTWMLVFTAKSRLDKGSYFPVTAVQRFDAKEKRIENGIYLGAIGSLAFEGKFSWKKRILAFLFEYLKIKVGPFGPFKISLGKQEREPNAKDPFFIWFYIDDEIAIAQGRGGGFAFWRRKL